MKTKNLILASVVFVIAIGSAAATKFVDIKDAYVEIQAVQNGAWQCVDSQVNCDDDGTLACNVRVNVTSIPAGFKDVRGKLVSTNCQTPLDNTSSTPIADGLPTVYDAR